MDGNRYVVLGEHTLGYINDQQPGVMGILHASVLKGSTFDRLAGFTHVQEGIDQLRPATKADFDEYRVCWRGHLPEEA